uniref:Ferritin heavy chain n=1 Tax=Macaca nemestrina TaxID=9545 RepID=A0A2K6CKI7_MACNE
MTTASTSQVHQNYHQDSEAAINRQINLELYASYVYLSIWGIMYDTLNCLCILYFNKIS